MTATQWTARDVDILSAVSAAVDEGTPAVLATVTAVAGSAYRRPGAKMLISPTGDRVGHVTADCLEGEVATLAATILDEDAMRVESFDLSDEDHGWGLGVGCNGVIDVLLEPASETYRPVCDALSSGRSVGLLTILDGDRAGARAHYDPIADALQPKHRFPDDLGTQLTRVARSVVLAGRSRTVDLGETTVFVDALTPPPRLLVIGTGHDAEPLVSLASDVGYTVEVVGYRGARRDAERFPDADSVVITSPSRLADAVELDAHTHAVVLTHNFVDDRLTVDTLLRSPVPYVGVMGPSDRFDEMRAVLREEGRRLSDDELDRVYAPVGLDIGAETPAEIALSILGEIAAVRRDRQPAHLRDRDGPIHGRPEPTPIE